MPKKLNNVPFLCTKLFQKRGHYSKGDIIQGGTLFKEIRYVFCKKEILAKTKFVCKVKYADSIYCFETRTNETTHYY